MHLRVVTCVSGRDEVAVPGAQCDVTWVRTFALPKNEGAGRRGAIMARLPGREVSPDRFGRCSVAAHDTGIDLIPQCRVLGGVRIPGESQALLVIGIPRLMHVALRPGNCP